MTTVETVHIYDGFWELGGRCGLQFFPGTDGIPVVVLSEVPSNNNTSITNLVECLAAKVFELTIPKRRLARRKDRLSLGTALWRRITRGEARKDDRPPLSRCSRSRLVRHQRIFPYR
jgi:hypothetical protein